ncbi:GntR family transcriptional regulator [Lentibacillus halodurans]|uniref:GntR family transcriptional regulator n=1 Tax=Lentibacillus halodurans TaxID=237679 RepID=A0A1I1AKM6_9BACI|nr:GntR family transcriptional regulator [Lentibacillus halodurans]SFB38575.1 GntR family transcriptional regulator [Lentibacillus halodurans]
MEVDKTLSIPLYQQIKDYLKEKIDSGEWEAGYRLAAERELAEQFSVSNITIKRAIHELVYEGYLHRQSGKGTFVIKKEEQDISKMVSLHNDKLAKSTKHPHKLLSFKKDSAGSKIAKKLHINQSDRVYKIIRLKIENGSPAIIEYSFVPSDPFPNLSVDDLEDNLLYNIYTKKYGVELNKAKIYFSTSVAHEYEEKLLNVVKGEQLIVLERFTTSKQQDIIEYSKFILKENQAKYYLEVQL